MIYKMTQLCYKLKSNGKLCRNYTIKNKLKCYMHDNNDNNILINKTLNYKIKIVTIISVLYLCYIYVYF
jgi:hypothetical protein